jgi:hypothetical protein
VVEKKGLYVAFSVNLLSFVLIFTSKYLLRHHPSRPLRPLIEYTISKTLLPALEDNVADVTALKRLAIICMENPIPEGTSEPHLSSSPTSPISKRSQTISHTELWETNQTFEKLFKALMTYLQPSKVSCFVPEQKPTSRFE